MKRVMKVFGIVILAVVVVVAALVVKGISQSKKPSVREDYYTEFSSPCPLEQKYSQLGGYAVSSVDTPSDDKRIGKIRVWYPSEAADTDALYPAILVVNASNTPAYKYEGWFKRLASWGFVVIGNEDPQAGTGETASITLDFVLNLPEDHPMHGRIDEDNIGIVGFSQGGAGALAAVSEYENGSIYKAIFTGSAAYQFMAGNFGWHYDVSKIHIPYFMAAGTGSTDDNGKADPTKEYAGVAPLSSLVENYNALPDSVAKVRSRATGAEHEDMLARSDGYMTAWMLYQLMGDSEAAKDEIRRYNIIGWIDANYPPCVLLGSEYHADMRLMDAALEDASVRHELVDPLAERGIEKQHCFVASERVDEVAKDAFDRMIAFIKSELAQ